MKDKIKTALEFVSTRNDRRLDVHDVCNKNKCNFPKRVNSEVAKSVYEAGAIMSVDKWIVHGLLHIEVHCTYIPFLKRNLASVQSGLIFSD
jgi:hypothetical protein